MDQRGICEASPSHSVDSTVEKSACRLGSCTCHPVWGSNRIRVELTEYTSKPFSRSSLRSGRPGKPINSSSRRRMGICVICWCSLSKYMGDVVGQVGPPNHRICSLHLHQLIYLHDDLMSDAVQVSSPSLLKMDCLQEPRW